MYVKWSNFLALASRFGGGQPSLLLANPISADLDAMRPSILPNLLQAAARNAARGLADLPEPLSAFADHNAFLTVPFD